MLQQFAGPSPFEARPAVEHLRVTGKDFEAPRLTFLINRIIFHAALLIEGVFA